MGPGILRRRGAAEEFGLRAEVVVGGRGVEEVGADHAVVVELLAQRDAYFLSLLTSGYLDGAVFINRGSNEIYRLILYVFVIIDRLPGLIQRLAGNVFLIFFI